ncbi:MAG: cysteine--tRNA ligase [Chloroflexi bacterium]|nr:cysteine--tRNA ligase [Chloroflexota bacterium]
MTLHLRDTLSRSQRAVRDPAGGGPVTMYSCGPTVYRYAHVGNLRTFLLPDLIRRALLYRGIPVRHVQNITDVGHLRDERFDRGDDPMLVAAGLESKAPAEIADAYEAAFHADAALLNLLPAHVYPRATEHIGAMVDLAARLEALGHAYRTDLGNVYYAVSSYPGYGQLSGNSIDALRAGHRGEVEPDKRDPADFALWKAAGDGRLLKWASPWGEGFPGWHLECSAMAMAHLGDRFDIHTGGEDNVFPHHEDEIAQSAPLVGGPPADLWVHGSHLLMEGRKMAKSAGNFQRITEVAAVPHDPLAFRYLCLTARYSRQLEYSEGSLHAAATALAALRLRLRMMGPPPGTGPWAPPPALVAGRAPDRPGGTREGIQGHGRSLDDAGRPAAEPALFDRTAHGVPPLSSPGAAWRHAFLDAVEDDLDLPTALGIVHRVVGSDLPTDERRWLVLDADAVLGLDLHRSWASGPASAPMSAAAMALVAAREAARQRRDFGTADRIRDQLRDLGYEPTDRADGTTAWRRVADEASRGQWDPEPGGPQTTRSSRPRKRSSSR